VRVVSGCSGEGDGDADKDDVGERTGKRSVKVRCELEPVNLSEKQRTAGAAAGHVVSRAMLLRG
jgi:hypothetical protein